MRAEYMLINGKTNNTSLSINYWEGNQLKLLRFYLRAIFFFLNKLLDGLK